MNNALNLALGRIHQLIPVEILEYAFSNRPAGVSIDEQILTHIIRGQVLKDANIYGGRSKQIVLRPEYREELTRNIDDAYMNTGMHSLYRIPPEARDNVAISEVETITFRGNYAGYVPNTNGWAGGVNLNTLGQAVLESHTFAASPPRPTVELLSGDLVKLTPSQHSQQIWVVTCRLCYDEDFTNLNTSSLDTFADLCVAAVKLYIYTRTIVQLDRSTVEAGYEIGTFKDIISGYSDAEERYKELRAELAGAMILSPDRLRTILPFII